MKPNINYNREYMGQLRIAARNISMTFRYAVETGDLEDMENKMERYIGYIRGIAKQIRDRAAEEYL